MGNEAHYDENLKKKKKKYIYMYIYFYTRNNYQGVLAC